MRMTLLATFLPMLTGCGFSVPVASLSTIHTGRVVTSSGAVADVPEEHSARLALEDDDGDWMAPVGQQPTYAVFVRDHLDAKARQAGYGDIELELRTPMRGWRDGSWLWIQTAGGRWVGVPERRVEAIEVTDLGAKRTGVVLGVVSGIVGGIAVIAAAIYATTNIGGPPT